MDTMFTLQHQQFHHQSLNSTVTSSTSSRSSTDHHTTTNYHHQPPEDCFNTFFMDEDYFSCSSSMQYYYSSQQFEPPTSSTPQLSKSQGWFSSSEPEINFSSQDTLDIVMKFSNSISDNNNNLRRDVLLEAARALADNNNSRLHRLMWMLNELSSPYGDIDEKLSSYFLQALYTRMTNSGPLRYHTLSSISKNMSTFESTRDLVLKFQEVSPWTTFGHVASNGAIMEAFEGETKLHIIDISNTYSTQWPTLLEAIATRTDETPHLRLTTIITTNNLIKKVMKEIEYRMEKFARLMGVPFEFNVIQHSGDLSEFDFNQIAIHSDEALAINLNGTLRSVPNHRRDYLISIFHNMNPEILAIVEEEADLDVGYSGLEFTRGFEECLRWFRVYFESLDESFPKTSNERLMLEREAGRAVMDLVACSPENSIERREKAERWSSRLRGSGFERVSYSEDGVDDVWALLRRYRDGWSTSETSAGMFLMWKETPVVWASAWKPI